MIEYSFVIYIYTERERDQYKASWLTLRVKLGWRQNTQRTTPLFTMPPGPGREIWIWWGPVTDGLGVKYTVVRCSQIAPGDIEISWEYQSIFGYIWKWMKWMGMAWNGRKIPSCDPWRLQQLQFANNRSQSRPPRWGIVDRSASGFRLLVVLEGGVHFPSFSKMCDHQPSFISQLLYLRNGMKWIYHSFRRQL